MSSTSGGSSSAGTAIAIGLVDSSMSTPPPRRQVVGVPDSEIQPDHIVFDRHRGIDGRRSGMIPAAHPGPADAVLARQCNGFLHRARHDEAAEAVVAVDQRRRLAAANDADIGVGVEAARLDAADVLRQAKDAVPVGNPKHPKPPSVGGALGCRRCDADGAVGRGDKPDQLLDRDPGGAIRVFGHDGAALTALRQRLGAGSAGQRLLNQRLILG